MRFLPTWWRKWLSATLHGRGDNPVKVSIGCQGCRATFEFYGVWPLIRIWIIVATIVIAAILAMVRL